MKKIYNMHGVLDYLKSGRAKEFYGVMKRCCESKNIKVTKSRTYHPESQEKSRTLRTLEH